MLQLLEPFHNAIIGLSESQNNITKVFGIYKPLENTLMPSACDADIVKNVKSKTDSHFCRFRCIPKMYVLRFMDKMDSLQPKIDLMINPYISSTKENNCVENDLIHYMDDNVTSQQHQTDRFLQWHVPSKDDPYELWRDNADAWIEGISRKVLYHSDV